MYTAKTILVPVDFSDTARYAISVALQMADRDPESRIILLHVDKNLKKEVNEVLAENQETQEVFRDIRQLEEGVRAAVEKEYERAAAKGFDLRRAPLDIRITSGDWLDVALQLIEDEKVNLVVAATHGGEGGLKGMLLGSLTERLVHKAPCSVFVIKAEGFPYLTD